MNLIPQNLSNDTAKRRWRRNFSRRQKKAARQMQQADDKIERLLLRRFDSLVHVKRFTAIWVSLFIILIFVSIVQLRGLSAYYQELKPAAGGIYNEGTVDLFSNANPVYATGLTDLAVSRLVFSGLLKYNDQNKLVGDLAEKWQLAKDEKRYVVNLKKDVRWHDGQKFTADDVVFTYKTIQDSESQSPFFTTWRGITVTKHDEYTVIFDLPNTLSSFPHSLTNGIIPAHLLNKVPVSELRSAAFNSNPVGTGPFQWQFVSVSGTTLDSRQQRISLSAYKHYHLGRPKLDSIGIITFGNEKQLLQAFKKKQLNAVAGLNAIPEEFSNSDTIKIVTTPLSGEVMAFFNNSRAPLNSAKVRQALVQAVDTKRVLTLMPYSLKKADSPLLADQLGYDSKVTQLPYDPAAANKLLDSEGWGRGADGIRTKAGKPLKLELRSQDTKEYIKMGEFLQKQWAQIGVQLTANYHSNSDLQRAFIAGHDYDILLYGISLGADPDVFAYWHSSQANISSAGHLNLSEYKSSLADQTLEAARTRSDPALRASKYKTFLSAWRQDAPALALYQPNFLYITNGSVFGMERESYNTGADRFYNVQNWMVRQERRTIQNE